VLSNVDVQESARGIDFNLLLDSERRLAEADIDYHRSVVAYAVALKNVYVETGSLMEYCNVHYTEPKDAAGELPPGEFPAGEGPPGEELPIQEVPTEQPAADVSARVTAVP
jgi:hypothetical protein